MSTSTNPPASVQAAALADVRSTTDLGADLANKDLPLADRFRVLFTLRNIGGEDGVAAIARAFEDDSVLLKHEVAYVLGQMKDPAAVETLLKVLADEDEDPMVRHEAGEALGAIGDEKALPALVKYAEHEDPVIAETCALAVALIEWTNSEEGKAQLESGELGENPYLSVDPAPPAAPTASVAELKETLNNADASLFARYRALFALRNEGSDAAVEAICSAFDDASALFRHELAYVLGQMQSPVAVDALAKVLKDGSEHCMVRHEAAEALGSIAHDDCLPLLQTHQSDAERVVSESCQVALDMADYEASGAFEYVA
ncbi:deoxyhypusine hydroxylase [Thecamonas trahens ATCC 50062]|uniref:Deoxyhypusine hydroxylase n=1 Tax=Thecamonas trahens ATCC 50062 TaxID=461836 RepID=A0A0L0DHV5_THETB|nr:deoxyhypusine hydroxylase [Thecamonas trahens ATCC 50062]KNC51892.1 deoxyhypusine hydroxylase [Thecamonas trahens ATCC 50062]|eukprot:XP_013755749.1 deoxyhypusine hydroxylase [Thecamonas trahens ATCC 50062]